MSESAQPPDHPEGPEARRSPEDNAWPYTSDALCWRYEELERGWREDDLEWRWREGE